MDIRPIQDRDVDAFIDLMDIAFHGHTDEELRAEFRHIIEVDRAIAAFDGDQMIGTAGTYSFDLTVPGRRTLPMAGTTFVTVRPTHRRRGVLRQLMAAHLDAVRARGEPLAGLWASEATIYGQFGYGCAIDAVRCRIKSDRAVIEGPIDDRLKVGMIDKDQAEEIFPRLYEDARLLQSGMLSRKSAHWWRVRRFADLPGSRGGATPFRYVLVTRDGEPRGYAQYRTKDVNHEGIAFGEVDVKELLALDLDAELALWRFLFSIDLTAKVIAPFRSADDPILHRLTDRRAIQLSASDGVYLRLMDVASALGGRSYAIPGTLAIEVAGPTDLEGTYRLEVDENGEARCAAHDGAADIRLDAKTLASAYLGGSRISTLANAGRIAGSREAIAFADALFVTERAPIAREVF